MQPKRQLCGRILVSTPLRGDRGDSQGRRTSSGMYRSTRTTWRSGRPACSTGRSGPGGRRGPGTRTRRSSPGGGGDPARAELALFSGHAGEGFGRPAGGRLSSHLVDLDPRDDALLVHDLDEGLAILGGLVEGLLEEDRARDVLPEARGGQEELAVRAAVVLGVGDANGVEALAAGCVGLYTRREREVPSGPDRTRRAAGEGCGPTERHGSRQTARADEAHHRWRGCRGRRKQSSSERHGQWKVISRRSRPRWRRGGSMQGAGWRAAVAMSSAS